MSFSGLRKIQFAPVLLIAFLGFISGCIVQVDTDTGFDLDVTTGEAGIDAVEIVRIPLDDVPKIGWDVIDEKGAGAFLTSFDMKQTKLDILGDSCDEEVPAGATDPCQEEFNQELSSRLDEIVDDSEITDFRVALKFRSGEDHLSDITKFLPIRLNFYEADPNDPEKNLNNNIVVQLLLDESTLVPSGGISRVSDLPGFKSIDFEPSDWDQSQLYLFDLKGFANDLKNLLKRDDTIGLRATVSIDTIPNKDMALYLAMSTGLKYELEVPAIGPLPPLVRTFNLTTTEEIKDPLTITIKGDTDILNAFNAEGSEVMLFPREEIEPTPLTGNPDQDSAIEEENQRIEDVNKKIRESNEAFSNFREELNVCNFSNLQVNIRDLSLDSDIFRSTGEIIDGDEQFDRILGPRFDFILFNTFILRGYQTAPGSGASSLHSEIEFMTSVASEGNKVFFSSYPNSPNLLELLRDSDQYRLFLQMDLNLKDSDGNLLVQRASSGEAVPISLNANIVAEAVGKVIINCNN